MKPWHVALLLLVSLAVYGFDTCDGKDDDDGDPAKETCERVAHCTCEEADYSWQGAKGTCDEDPGQVGMDNMCKQAVGEERQDNGATLERYDCVFSVLCPCVEDAQDQDAGVQEDLGPDADTRTPCERCSEERCADELAECGDNSNCMPFLDCADEKCPEECDE